LIGLCASYQPSLIERADESIYVAYARSSDGYLVSKTYATAWSSESLLVAASYSGGTCATAVASGDLIISYGTGAAILFIIRSVTPVPAVNTGDVPAPFIVTFQGPSTNPRIINQNTLEYIRLNTTLAAADHFDVDTTFGNKTVILTQGGIVKNGIAFLDIGSTFFQLERGTNVVYFEDDAVASTATASMEWTERYVGL